MDSDEDEEDITEDTIKKRQEITQWFRFCKEKIDKIHKVWDKKLGVKDNTPEPVDPESSDDDLKQENESVISEIFGKLNQRRANTERAKKEDSAEDDALKADIMKGLEQADAKSDVKEDQSYSDAQFWGVPDQYDIDDLMAEQDLYDIPDQHPKPWGADDNDKKGGDDLDKVDEKDESQDSSQD